MDPTEFAEIYSRGERLRFVLLGAIIGLPVICTFKFVIFPWLAQFSASAPCRTVLGIDGSVFLWYGLFVGMPLFLAVFIGFAAGHRGLRILQGEQFPPAGEKAFRRTAIRRGAAARRIGLLHLIAATPFLAIAIWGYPQAASLSTQLRQVPIKCAANNSFKPNPLRSFKIPSGSSGGSA
jgi:hypothetical protein